MFRHAIISSLTLGMFLLCLGLEPCEAQSGVAASARCEDNGGDHFIDLNDGTVLDCKTQLIWLKDASCAGLRGSDSDGKFAPSEVEANVRSYKDSWKDAQAAAAALADGKCGLTDGSKVGDWRLPTVSELKGLINKNFKNPAISNRKGDAKWLPGDAFIGVKSKIYWSATKDKGGGFTTVSFKSGTVYTKLPGAYVWPVRGGK